MTGPYRPRAVVCVVNGHTFYVRRIEECGGYRIPDYRPDIGKHTGKRGGYRVAKKWRRLVPPPPPIRGGGHGGAGYGGGSGAGYDGGYAYDGGYSYGTGKGRPRIVIGVGTSPAARMQQERRARKAAKRGYGYGYGYDAGYQGGYGGQAEGYSYGKYRKAPRKVKRKVLHRPVPVYISAPCDGGMAVYYGPVTGRPQGARLCTCE